MVDDITGDMILELLSLGGNTSDKFRYNEGGYLNYIIKLKNQ